MISEEHFIFDKSSYKTSLKSLKALKSHIKASADGNTKTPIHLIINLSNPIIKKNDYIPRIIPLPHKIDKASGKTILLITKDPSTPYRDVLMRKGSPTQDYITEIITLKKLKKIARNTKSLEKLYNEYELILCDHRIQKFLPGLLGVKFLKNKNKLPFLVQMSKPDVDNKLIQQKNKHKLKDENCDAEYVLKQLKVIARNTKFVPNESGTVLDVRIGFDDMEILQLLENIDTILKYLIDNKNLKSIIGVKENEKLIKGGIKMYRDVHIKTSESISLPIYKS